jgi:hypothetical protein
MLREIKDRLEAGKYDVPAELLAEEMLSPAGRLKRY